MTAQILLVAMNGNVRDALADWFRMLVPDCRVRHAAGAREAIALGGQDPPSLVVIQDGGSDVPCLQTIDTMRASAPDAPIVVLTNSDYAEHRERLVAAGASACVLPRRINVDLLDLLKRLHITGAATGANGQHGTGMKMNAKGESGTTEEPISAQAGSTAPRRARA
jgi:DNA-binding NarL/FixJ family response regulator